MMTYYVWLILFAAFCLVFYVPIVASSMNFNGICFFSHQGLKLELCTADRVGLLSDVTRIFRENSLTVSRAEVTTKDGKAVNTFYVRDTSGYPVDPKIIDSIRRTIGQTILQVKGCPEELNQVPHESPTRFLFSGLFKSRSFCNFGLVRSYSWSSEGNARPL